MGGERIEILNYMFPNEVDIPLIKKIIFELLPELESYWSQQPAEASLPWWDRGCGDA